MKIFILGTNQTMATSIIEPLDVLKMAAVFLKDKKSVKPGPEVNIISEDGKAIQCLGGLLLGPYCSIDEVKAPDIIMVSSINNIDETIKNQKYVIDWISKQHQAGVTIVSICTGAFLLAEAGLLDGKAATTHWSSADDFQRRYPLVNLKLEKLIVDEEDVLCSAGGNSSMDLSFYLIKKYWGPSIASYCAKFFVRDFTRSSQEPYRVFDRRRHHSDSQILDCQNWMVKNQGSSFDIKQLPSIANMSQRTFERRFKKATGMTPLTYLQQLRVEKAKDLLETTNDSFDEIAYQLGYNNCGAFRKIFTRYTSLLPSEYRNRFTMQNQY